MKHYVHTCPKCGGICVTGKDIFGDIVYRRRCRCMMKRAAAQFAVGVVVVILFCWLTGVGK